MGLFTNKKKLCPICGEPTPRIFSTKVEDMPLCKECAGKIFLPDGALEKMSLDDFREYMYYYEQNKTLRDIFQPTYEYPVGFSWMTIRMDFENGLFALHNSPNALVFEKSCIETYRILEDKNPLFQGHKTAIKFFESDIPYIVEEMAPFIMQFEAQKREYEMLERMEDMLDREDDRNNRPRRIRVRPSFNGQEPFKNFIVRVRMEHPYWQGIHQGKIMAPVFDNYYPRIDDYMREYNDRVNSLYDLALQFKELVNPNSKEIYDREKNLNVEKNTSNLQENTSVDVVEEIKKFKNLLDAGIITEEEFAAKKKQLMGI